MPQTRFTVETRGAGLYEITRPLAAFVARAGLQEAVLTVFVRHTSCSLLIQENADPDVRRAAFRTMRKLFERLHSVHPGIDTLSLGMSDDAELAIEEGSTMVRIGSALFGPRPSKHEESTA